MNSRPLKKKERAHNLEDGHGVLFVVATPIGNLGDISARAIETLKTVDLVLAEDTRTFGILARTFGLSSPCESYHDHNELSRTARILPLLQSGKRIALVSEAGTPGISDPGYRIIKACTEAGISIVPVPGACAAISALSISGFEIHAFSFLGFAPIKSGKRLSFLKEILEGEVTTVVYESPHRIVKTLAALCEIAPERDVCLARELTKQHEEILRGSAQEVHDLLAARKEVKGELVLIIRGS